jgi:hypothetical protein
LFEDRYSAFPQEKLSSATINAIKGNLEKKLAILGPRLEENGPRIWADIVMPEIFDGRALTLEGQAMETVDADGLANRRCVWCLASSPLWSRTTWCPLPQQTPRQFATPATTLRWR